jgi:hypothetical protein
MKERLRRALLIGIDAYQNFSELSGCVDDAKRMCEVLKHHEDKTPNYDCRLFTSSRKRPIDGAFLKQKWDSLFHDFKGDILFYYSGHGAQTNTGNQFVAHDGNGTIPGLGMNDLLTLANLSPAREIVLILDCCFAAGAGDPMLLGGNALLREGVTILAGSSSIGFAREIGGHGVFTDLVISALNGGAADVQGHVSAASVYAYVDQALGAWDQRPIYKSYTSAVSALRRCQAPVPHNVLRELPQLFKKPDSFHRMNPSYEHTHKSAKKDKVEIFNKFKILRDARLLRTVDGHDLFFAALERGAAVLTPLGQFYWRLSKNNRI